jgi:hypothetical protein
MARRSRTQKQKRSSRKQQRGGRRMSRKASSWAKAVKRVYDEMKRENSNVSLKDAMMRASQLRKQGKL